MLRNSPANPAANAVVAAETDSVARALTRRAQPDMTGLEIVELSRSLPAVDDLSRSIRVGPDGSRFHCGDLTESRMTDHLWESILRMGLSEEDREAVIASGIRPTSLTGPMPTRAGLRLMRAGVFYAVNVRNPSSETRWLRGTILKGGHVDRLVAEDCVLSPGRADRVLACFACEGHRTPTSDLLLQPVPNLVAPPTFRMLAKTGDQFALWERIARFCQRFAPNSRSLLQTLNAPGIEAVVREELPRHLANLSDPSTPGSVMCHDGTPVAADLFTTGTDFAQFAEGLTRGYIVEAMLRAGAHSTGALEVIPVDSRSGRRALARLVVGRKLAAHLESWHTSLFS